MTSPDAPADAAFAPNFPSAEWLADLRARGSEPAFAAARAALDARVDGYHAVLPAIPARQAGYYHQFFCPTHAVQLVFNPRDGHRHVCPVDGIVFSGEPFDSAWGWSVNDALSDAALRTSVRRTLGHAAERSGADGDLIRHVLLGYAERYRTMPPAPQGHPSAYSGMVCWSALDESVWIIRLVWAAALARDAFSADELVKLRDGLFSPAMAQLLGVRYQQIQNVGNWDRGAILNLALFLGDDAIGTQVLDEEFGIRDQLTRGVTSDGLWWELSLSYHFYVLGAVSWTMRALRAAGRSFDKEAVIQSMFQAPLDLAFPDLSLPATNDCWYHIGLTGEVGHGIPNAEGFYEMAFGWFRNPMFAWVVRASGLEGKPRATLEGLLDGAAELPMVKRGETRPRHFDGSGLAMLRAGAGPDAAAVLLKASPDDGDAHGHPDQLGIALFAAGGRIAIDPGTPGYGISLNDTWYRQSAAHSTVLLDSQSQPPGQARITRFEEADDAVIAEAEITWPAPGDWPAVVQRATEVWWPDRDPSMAYAGVRMRRRLELREGSLLDTFTVDAPAERVIDLVLQLPAGTHTVDHGDDATTEAATAEVATADSGTVHGAPAHGDAAPGAPATGAPARGAPATGSTAHGDPAGRTPAGGTSAPDALRGACGYDDLTAVVALPEQVSLAAPLPRGTLLVALSGDQPADHARFLASAPGNPAADRHVVFVRRRTAASATFVTSFTWDAAAAPWRSSSSNSG